MSLLSNNIVLDDIIYYDIDISVVVKYVLMSHTIEFFNDIKTLKHITTIKTKRNSQLETLKRLKSEFSIINDSEWLNRRGISNYYDISHTDLLKLNDQEKLDLYIIPHDYLIDKFGFRAVDGLVFPDIQNKKLYGICVRNISTDKNWVAHAKYTFSNYGLYIYGLDDIDINDEVYLCEGVFDVLAFRSIGKQAICFGSSSPTPYQMARIARLTKPIICMDNDFYGWCGAYELSVVMGIDNIVLSKHKDPAETIFDNKTNEFSRVTKQELELLIKNSIPIHNSKISEVKNLEDIRNLKYN